MKSKPGSNRFSLEQLRLCCLLIFCSLTSIPVSSYIFGLLMQTYGEKVVIFIFSLTAIIILPFALAFCVKLIRDVTYRKLLPPKYLFNLLLLPAACVMPILLPIPQFNHGVATRIYFMGLSGPLINASKKEVAQSRNPISAQEYGQALTSKPPFDRLPFESTPFCEVKNSTLFITFGSTATFQWRIAISGKKGHPPYFNDMKVYGRVSVRKEIVVYTSAKPRY